MINTQFGLFTVGGCQIFLSDTRTESDLTSFISISDGENYAQRKKYLLVRVSKVQSFRCIFGGGAALGSFLNHCFATDIFVQALTNTTETIAS